jgi:hypothetical protein
MSYTEIDKTVYKCHCEAVDHNGVPCGHNWEAESYPDRCPACGRRTWDKKDGRRHNQPYTAHGKTQTLSAWAEELGVTTHALKWRLKSGMPVAQALSKGDRRFAEVRQKKQRKAAAR